MNRLIQHKGAQPGRVVAVEQDMETAADEEFWLRDAASILRENGSVQHATHVDRAAGCQAVMAATMREAYVALAFAFNRLHGSPRSRDTELCDRIGKTRGRIERAMKEAGYAL